MCNCIKEVEERTKNNIKFKNEDYKYRTVTKVSILNKSLMFDAKQSLQLSSPVRIEYDALNKKDILMHKKEVLNIIYHFCPFCGCKYE